MTGWRARLAALRAQQADAESAVSAERPRASSPAEATGANGATGTGIESTEEAGGAAPLPAGNPTDPGDAAEQAERAERAAMAKHYAAPPAPCPWRPGDPDPLRDGLLAGWRVSRSGRLAAAAQRLEAGRPRQAWGVRKIDWQAWEDAARAAAGLPGGEWVAWRATVGTGETAWPQCGTADRNSFARAGDHGL